eukprot:SAG11_NODE_2001_length_3939_cov_26.376672_2_plen_92_part_00
MHHLKKKKNCKGEEQSEKLLCGTLVEILSRTSLVEMCGVRVWWRVCEGEARTFWHGFTRILPRGVLAMEPAGVLRDCRFTTRAKGVCSNKQ